MPDYFNLWTPNELAEFGIASKDGLAQALGASLEDHIAKLDSVTELLIGNLEISVRDLESVAYELEALAARANDLRENLARIEEAMYDIKGKLKQ
jgi:hypothetical protein